MNAIAVAFERSRAVAQRNVQILNQHPRILDPLAAINFAIELGHGDAVAFLESWRDGAWSETADHWPKFLERVK